MSVVIDASAFLALVLPDEKGLDVGPVKEAITNLGAVVPSHWTLEVQNGILFGVRRGRFDSDTANVLLDVVRSAGFVVDGARTEIKLGAEFALAHRFGLTIYDAAYLELAQRYNAPLITLDRRLADCAASLGLAWHPGYSPLVRRRGRRAS